MNQLPRLVLFLSVGESLMSQILELQKFTSLIIFLQIILVWTLFAFSVQACFSFLLQKTSRLACILQDVSPVLRFYEKTFFCCNFASSTTSFPPGRLDDQSFCLPPPRSRVTLSSSLWKMARLHQRIIAFAKSQTPTVKKAA